MFETRKCMDWVSSDISGTVFSPNAQFYVYLTFGSRHARFISLFMVFVALGLAVLGRIGLAVVSAGLYCS